jgi:hypothetical protein
VRMHYQSFGSDEPSERNLNPYAVYFDPDGATLKVIGWDHNRKDFIPFSIDHIQTLQQTNRHFTRRPFNLREHLEAYCFNGIHGKQITVRLRTYGVTARIFAERKFHRTQRTITLVSLSRMINGARYEIDGIAINISPGGIAIHLFAQVAIGSRLQLQADDGSFSATVVVRHCTRMPSGWIVGLEIIEQRGADERR